MEQIVIYLFINGTEIYKFKAKDSEIVASPLCLGNISKDWLIDNMIKKQVLMDMSMTLVLIIMLLILMIDDIKDIHEYLMKKDSIV